jgi:hypothetical protein
MQKFIIREFSDFFPSPKDTLGFPKVTQPYLDLLFFHLHHLHHICFFYHFYWISEEPP